MPTVPDIIDNAVAEYYCKKKEYKKGLDLYREMISLQDGKDKQQLEDKFFKYAYEYAAVLAKEDKWGDALLLYKEILSFPNHPVTVLKNIGLCLKAVECPNEALTLLEKFKEKVPNNAEVHKFIGELYYSDLKDYEKAIEYYERALDLGEKTFQVYSMLGHLYSTYHRDHFKERQIEYLKEAYNLEPDNRIAVKNLAYVLGKFGMTEEADKYYKKLLKLDPLHSDLHSYGAYLVRNKRFEEGFKYLRHRFWKEDLEGKHFPDIFFDENYGWTPEKKIKGKDIVVYYEQGFGDTIMFSRFIPELKKKCKSVSVVVQEKLLGLFEDSNFGVNFYTPLQLDNIKFDLVIPMMDLPVVCKTTVDTIPLAKGYLSVPKKKVETYKKEYIGDNKTFKIGIAYEGTLSSKETQRDIELKYYYPLMQLPNVTVYSFQVDDLTEQMKDVPEDFNFVKLGQTFKNWEDTACAMKCMDLMVTTDNGVMNLAGALGVPTFGLFNSITEWRWFKTTGEDIAWYKSIRPFQCTSDNNWGPVISQVVEEVKKLAK